MCVYVGLPWWLSGRESTCYVGATGDAGLTPGSGRSPGEGNGYPVQYSCLENPLDREAHGVTKESDMTQLLNNSNNRQIRPERALGEVCGSHLEEHC